MHFLVTWQKTPRLIFNKKSPLYEHNSDKKYNPSKMGHTNLKPSTPPRQLRLDNNIGRIEPILSDTKNRSKPTDIQPRIIAKYTSLSSNWNSYGSH